MTKKILVGVDGSEPSRAAIHWALDRAKQTGQVVQLEYVSDVTPFSDAPALLSEAIEAGKLLLERERQYAEGLGTGVSIVTGITSGVPVREFDKLSGDVDLLAIGTHKGSRLQGVILGTRGIKIAAIARCPVAVIPVVDLADRHGIVVGIDKDGTGAVALDFAVAEAKRTGEPVSVVYAWSMPTMPGLEYIWSAEIAQSVREDADQVVAETVEKLQKEHPGIDISGVAVQGPPVSALVSQAKDARLLVVGNRGRRGLSRLLLGSVSHGVLNNIPSPVVVVRSVDVPAEA